MGPVFRVLGPLEVAIDSAVVPLPPGRARVLLATLLLRANEIVSADELIDRLWDGAPPNPGRAKPTLQMVVSRLRQALGDADCVRTSADGYFAEVDPTALDLHRFRTLVAAGRIAEALALWRGAPLSNVVSDFLHRDEVPALVDEHLDVVARRIDADLDAGEALGLVTELRTLTRQHPLREGFWAQLMLALYRSDQQAEALAAYRTVRDLLADELGVDPGARLREVYQRILAAEPVLQRAEPRQLPPEVSRFVGRRAELAALDKRAKLVVLHGIGGVGKTALALHWAHRMRAEFPDGELYLNLRGFDSDGSPITTAAAAETLLLALGCRPEDVPAALDARSALLRTLLADRRMLLFLDNVVSSSQIVPLLPGAPHVAVLVTSRNQLRGLAAQHGAHRVEVRPLTSSEATELLSTVLGNRRMVSDGTAGRAIIERCGALPLALRVFAERVARFPDTPLRTFAAELRDERTRLDTLSAEDGDDTDVRTVLSWSYRALDEGPARLFRLLSLHPGRSIGVAGAAALAGEPVAVVRRHLERLAADHLIQSPAPGRYDFHDLLRAYAGELGGYDDKALHRLVDWYIWTLNAAVTKLPPRSNPFPLGPAPDSVTPDSFEDRVDSREWCEAEWPNLVAVTRRAAELGWHDEAWRIPDTLGVFVDLHARGDELVEIFEIAMAHAPTPTHHLLALTNAAWAYSQVGRPDDAIAAYEEVIEAATAAGDRRMECVARVNISSTCERQTRYSEARVHLAQGLALAQEIGDEHIQAASLNNLAQLSSTEGDHEEALRQCAAATALFTKLGNDYGVGRVMEQRARAENALGRYDQAVDTHRQGISMMRRFGDRYTEARQLTDLGHALLALGRVAETRDCWRQALDVMGDYNESLAAQLRTGLAELADTTIVELAERRGG